MGEDYLNNNEETAALFVSAQKKKKAEEEAKRKAAQEQAKRDAAEAEVRKMEQEVEERKRKAEEEAERLRQEELHKDETKAAAKASSVPKTSASKTSETKAASGDKPKSKAPLFIGIGVAAVAVIAVAAVALGGSGKSESSSTASADEGVIVTDTQATQDQGAEALSSVYTPNEARFDIPVAYDNTKYSEVTEEPFKGSDGTEGIRIHFTPTNDAVPVDILMTDYYFSGSGMIGEGELGWVAASSIAKNLGEYTKTYWGELIEGMEFSDELSTDITDSDSNPYSYNYTFTAPEIPSGIGASYLVQNGNGDYKGIRIICSGSDKTTESAFDEVSNFLTVNFSNYVEEGKLLCTPGSLPPESTVNDEILRVEDIHLGIPVPSGQFKKNRESTDINMWCDKNGASIVVDYFELDAESGAVYENSDELADAFKDAMIEHGADSYLGGLCESRTYESDMKYNSDYWTCAYQTEFKDVIGGVDYHERYFISYWRDVTTGKTYFYIFITLVPYENRDVYMEIFDASLKDMKDI